MNGSTENFLEGNGILIVLFFFLAMNGGLNGFGNNGNGIQNAFENQNVINKLDTMATGLGNATWSLNDGLHMLGNKIDNCCCTTQKELLVNRYEAQKNTCDIINANHNETQRVLDAINHYATEQKDMKIAEQGQLLSEARIVAAMKPQAPIPAYQVPSPYASYGCNGCGNLY